MTDRPSDIATRLAKRLFDRPLIQNSFRGAFVEEMIAPLLEPYGWSHCGDDWSSWDFEHSDGCRLEVKQSAAAQSWLETGGSRRGIPTFSIAEKGGYWTGGVFTSAPGRHAHIYLFAWHPIVDRIEADHRKLHQWTFFLLPTAKLPQSQKGIRLSVLKLRGATQVPSTDLGKVLDEMRQVVG